METYIDYELYDADRLPIKFLAFQSGYIIFTVPGNAFEGYIHHVGLFCVNVDVDLIHDLFASLEILKLSGCNDCIEGKLIGHISQYSKGVCVFEGNFVKTQHEHVKINGFFDKLLRNLNMCKKLFCFTAEICKVTDHVKLLPHVELHITCSFVKDYCNKNFGDMEISICATNYETYMLSYINTEKKTLQINDSFDGSESIECVQFVERIGLDSLGNGKYNISGNIDIIPEWNLPYEALKCSSLKYNTFPQVSVKI